ncbi:MAG: prepilin-type N-terminal cleavage/methylation domain-containing protein [Luteimonas sp.]
MHIPHRRILGFTLLEVMVSIAIASFGLIALATMQMSLVRASAESRTQSVAIALAKEKLEQLRSFETSSDYLQIDSEGAEAISREGVDYSRATTISRYAYSTTTNVFVAKANTADEMGAKDFKQVRVTVTWTEATGTARSVSLEDVLDGISPSDSAKLLAMTSDGGARKVQARIKDPAADDMVIPMALSSDVESAATNPKPNVVRGVNTVETSFDVITYSGLNSADDTRVAQAKVETKMVGCTCDYGAASGNTAKRPTYWNGTRYTVPINASYTAPAGPASAYASQQSNYCDICCRDHHDPVGTKGATFSPLRVTKASNTVSAAHPHYTDRTTILPVATGIYQEACRLIRVDGIWSVAADLYNDYFALLATGNGIDAATPVPDSTSTLGSPSITGGAVARYQNFVIGYLDQRFVKASPSSGSEQATYNAVGAPYSLAASDTYVLDEPASININLVDADGKWLHSRGLYVDYLEKDAVDAITQAKLTSTCQASGDAMSTCILKLLPFTTINLTELGDWSPTSGPLAVTNNDFSASRSAAMPVRGNVTTNASAAMDSTVTTYARKSNSGLLDLSFDAISADDATALTDTQLFKVGGGAATDTGSELFWVQLTMPTSFVGTPQVSYVTGTLASKGCSSSGSGAGVLTQTCNVSNGSASAGLGVANTMAVLLNGFNKTQTSTASASIDCSYGGGGTTTGWPVIQSGSVLYPVNVCPNYQVASATNDTLGESATSIGTNSDGLVVEEALIKFGRLNPGDQVKIVFNTTATTTTKPASCYYTCNKGEIRNGTSNSCQADKKTLHFTEPPACP